MNLNLSRKPHVSEDEVLSAIAWGATTARAIVDYTSGGERAVDKALQRARRKGLIKFVDRAWSIVDGMPPEAETELERGNGFVVVAALSNSTAKEGT